MADRPSAVTRQKVALAAAPNLAEVVAGLGAFSAELHRSSATVAANWTVSPLSIALAFGMLRAGSRGTTADEIDDVFGFPAGSAAQGSAHAALNALAANLVTSAPVPKPREVVTGRPEAAIVAIANGLFIDQTYSDVIEPEFLTTLAANYGASPTTMSFADPAAAHAINEWVARQTRDRITKLFDRLDPETCLVLANAVYLKATWMHQFSEHATTDGPFTTAGGHPVPARLMHERFQSVRYAARDGWQRVSLPYVGNELAMRIVIPTGHAADVASLAPALAAASQPAARDDRPAWVELTLPRWDTATVSALLIIVPSRRDHGSGAVGPRRGRGWSCWPRVPPGSMAGRAARMRHDHGVLHRLECRR
ncbi:MAG: serpin family protein, partial [Pseudonocardiales bacterium]